MRITCLTKDSTFVEELKTLYDQISVEVFADYREISKSSLKSCDVLIVDLKDCLLPDGNIFFSPILALSPVPVYLEAAAILRTGAKGYGNRHMRKENLWQAIESVKAGQVWLPPEIVAALIEKIELEKTDTQKREKLLSELSEREREVALMVAEGMSNQQIADKIYVSLRTVKAHLSSIYSKTGLRNRLELGLRLKG